MTRSKTNTASSSNKVSASTDLPARSRCAAALCTDANYLPYTLFVADQLQRSSGMTDLDIVIVMSEDCRVPASLEHLNIRVCHLETNGIFKGLFQSGRLSEAAYHCIALPAAFENDYDRILYLDSDVFIHGGDFSALFALDMEGQAVAAVRDIQQWIDQDRYVSELSDLGLPNQKYFNSGVMLFDVQTFNSLDLLNKCIAFGVEKKALMTFHDQQLLNGVLHGDWKEISPVWNWQQPVRSPVFEGMIPVSISHFIGRNKPWRCEPLSIAPRFTLPVQGFLRQHFPDYASSSTPRARDFERSYIRRLSIKNILRTRNLKRYLDRFPEDLGAEP